MPFIPHTDAEVTAMLEAIEVSELADLFDEIPAELRVDRLTRVPPGLNEMEVRRLMLERAGQDGTPDCFCGAGAYEHHIPAAVWEITTRGEFYSAYTPYQAEASQGTLQLIYEYQTMMCGLTGLDVSNASLYDGASALAEAVLMAVRAHRRDKARTILVPRNVHPAYRKVLHSIVPTQDITVVELDYDAQGGHLNPESLSAWQDQPFTALVIPQPGFFGGLEETDALTDWAHERGALVIATCNPTALALLKPPGQWGGQGADIAVGDGQPLGVPLSSGGPYYGYLTCRQALVRQMPGRLVGRTVDLDGNEGFALTLQAREQHIRRAKATSNICTNQGLMVTASTLYMSMLGPEGLRRVAAHCNHNTERLVSRLEAIDGVSRAFDRPIFHECVLRLGRDAGEVVERLARDGVVAGFALGDDYPELADCLLVCATETKSEADIERFASLMRRALAA